jgi:hypothetical protein
MECDRESAVARDVERLFECERVREGGLAPRKIKRHNPKVLGGNCGRCEVAILFQRMGAEGGDDEAHLNAGFCGCATRPRRNGSDDF